MKSDLGKLSNLTMSTVGQISRYVNQWLERALSSTDTSLQEFKIIGLLMGSDDITQKTLAEYLSVRPATLSVAITNLENKGYIQRVTSQEDKRVNYIRLTKNVDMEQGIDILHGLEEKATNGITKKDLAVTQRVLNQIAQNLKEG